MAKFPAAVLLCLLAQGSASLAPVRHPTCVRFYCLEGDPKPEALRKAVDSLGTKDAPARVVSGPDSGHARPKEHFVAVEVPTTSAPKDVEAALKKVCPRTEELFWTAFQGKSRSLPSILAQSPLDCVIGMDNNMRWFDLSDGRARFFFTQGKLDAKTIQARFEKLYQPFNAGELGELVKESIEWRLAEPLDAAAAKAAEKALARIPGIRHPRIDAATRVLSAEVEQDGLRGSMPGAKGVAAADFLVDDVLAALDAAKVALEAGGEKR
jgi:hypothetical protein